MSTYRSNGGGRDSYIACNSGGFHPYSTSQGFEVSLRASPNRRVIRKDDHFAKGNATWMSPKYRGIAKEKVRLNKEIVDRLYKTNPRATTLRKRLEYDISN